MTTYLEPIHLIGLSFKGKTTNANGQAAIDCGNHWQEFEQGGYAGKIPGTVTELYAVYHDYESDHTGSYSYFIGGKVAPGTAVPEGMDSLVIAGGKYKEIIATGKMPDCIAGAWRDIWASGFERAYTADFEVYGPKSTDWNNAEVSIFLAMK
jgi:predicted transcriptional regulator YdeE